MLRTDHQRRLREQAIRTVRCKTVDVQVPADYRRPKSFQIGELFKIEKGQIRQIEAVLLDVPYGMKSGWGAHTSLPRTTVQAMAGCDHDCLVGFVDRYLAALTGPKP